MSKNLFINSNFICRAALMSGDETKQLLFWCYNYIENGIIPSEEDLENASVSVYNAFNDYMPYLDYCIGKWTQRIKKKNEEKDLETELESELEKQRTKLFREINEKKDEIINNEEIITDKGTFLGKLKPNDNF